MSASLPDSDSQINNLGALLRAKAAEHGSRVAFRFLADGETEVSHLTYTELDLKARAIAALLTSEGAEGERALLFYSAGLDFIAAFWGCVYAGVVGVPVFPARLHRHLPRLLSIAADAEPKFVLTTAKQREQAEDLFKRAPELKKFQWAATDDVPTAHGKNWRGPETNSETLALLQYTSGSTAAPRGVMVTHGNLLHNLARLREVFQFSCESVGVTWLPHYHDMGLIGGLLQPIYAGGEMAVMPPSAFLQRPIRWLEALTRYRATTMTAPNFAYELCVQKIPAERRTGLDLSSVNVALCGAEPVRPDTLAQFAEAFSPIGFRKEAFRPAYGLAEATLIVSGRANGGEPFVRNVLADELRQNRVVPVSPSKKYAGTNSRTLMGCGGVVPGLSVTIVDPETLLPSAANRIGEIWIAGPSVAQGYWHKPEQTKETFNAHLATGEGPFLRTGDLGFLDAGSPGAKSEPQVFVTGRLKDLIIIRGANLYPQDLEHTVERSHRALRPACGAAFSMDVDGTEQLVIVQEVTDRSSVPNEEVVTAIRRALTESHEVHPDAVVLIEPRSIPRTSSGKIQRYASREAFLSGTLEIVHEWRDPEGRADRKQKGTSHPRSGLVWDYLSTQTYSHRLAGNAHENQHANARANGGGNTGDNGRHDNGNGNAVTTIADPIAIVGIGCRLPGAADLQKFWQLLRDGVDTITETPRERWDIEALYDPAPGVRSKMSTRWGGYLPDIDKFDTHFFGISPREAAGMDPQQRLLLEVSWEALENAGQPPDKLAGSRTGVFIGIGGFDYSNVILNYKDHLQSINAYSGTGNAHSIAANRISYLLDLRGPSVAIDTACSSSLVAIHMACESLRSGQADLALAGAVNLILSPEVTIAFSHARMMAADGRCKTFDAKADGYVRAEGCGVVVLKRLSAALHDRDHILGLIRGSAVNQDGRTAGIAAPNASAQQAVIREALVQAGVGANELSYIEAHGTGTSIGDPIELEAVKGVLGKSSAGDVPCLIGSVKANIGHLENASGMASLAKVLLCFEHGEIPAQLHYSKLNPRISLKDTRIAISEIRQPWPVAARRLAGVSSFGFGGTNAHLIVENAPIAQRLEHLPSRPGHIFTLSARTDSALKSLAKRYEEFLSNGVEDNLADICFTANAGRSQFVHRLAVVVEDKTQLQQALAAYIDGNASNGASHGSSNGASSSVSSSVPKGVTNGVTNGASNSNADASSNGADQSGHEKLPDGLFAGHAARKDGPRVAFIFSGQESNASAAFPLYDSQPVFRSAIERCSQFLSAQLNEPLLAVLSSDTSSREARDAALFAMEYALAELWQSWGIEPDAVIGTGVGEFAAAVVAGVMSCEDGLKLVVERSRCAQLVLHSGKQIGVSERAKSRMESGRRTPTRNDECGEFDSIAGTTQFHSPKIPFVSGATGHFLTESEIPDSTYWHGQVIRYLQDSERNEINADGIKNLAAQGYDVFVEVGAPDSFAEIKRQSLACERRAASGNGQANGNGHGNETTTGTAVKWVSSLESERGAWQTMLTSLASLYVRGANVDWKSYDEPYRPFKMPLPTYPFERERCWEEPPADCKSQKSSRPAHPLLGERLNSALPMAQFQKQFGVDGLRYLGDHRVQGTIVVPAAAYLEMARAASVEVFGTGPQVLSNVAFVEALILPSTGTRTVQLVASPATSGSASFQIFSSVSNPAAGRENAAWTLHASGDMHMDTAEASRSTGEPERLDAIRARCTKHTMGRDLYQSLKQMGLEYGPDFQGVDQIWSGLREALGEVRLPAKLQSSDGGVTHYGIHPSLLDSCVQVLAAALPEDCQKTGRKWTYLPSAVASLRFTGRPGTHIFSHCVIRSNGGLGAEFFDADIRLLDEGGHVVSELLGFRVKLVGGEVDREVRENPEDLLYDIVWVPKGSVTSGQPKHAEQSSWLIIADQGTDQNNDQDSDRSADRIIAGSDNRAEDRTSESGARGGSIGRALAVHLQSRGENCTVVNAADVCDLTIPVDCRNVIYLPSLDLRELDEGPRAAKVLQAKLIETVQFVQALLRQSGGSKRRLWFVTRGAQAVGAAPTQISLAQTPLLGLAKSIDLEHPELRCTRVDLDSESSHGEVAALAQELSLSGSEHEVAFRKGTRHVARLVPRPPKHLRGSLLEVPAAESFRLDITRPGNVDHLILQGSPRSAPRSGEVEIQVRAAGLNFRDVMNAAGVYPGGPIPFGAECAGIISALGPDVTGLQIGEEVIAVASGSFGSFVNTDARAVITKPSSLTFEQAATIPIAFLTAYYSLHQLAHLSRGERVLIHGAAGGVGLAAVQLAQRAGAEIFATAGSPEKRAHLTAMGVPHVLDSRSLLFADEVMKITSGQGVDVVLNSLPGEYITRSLSVLTAYGRFVEIGKTDIYLNKPMGLFPFRNNLSYFALDLDRVCRERPMVVRSLLLELMAMFNDGSLQPLPQQLFPITDAANAFRYIARRKNIGKVVLTLPESASSSENDQFLKLHADATYLITGGHGSLGIAVAQWLAQKGARNLALLSRTGAVPTGKNGASELTNELAKTGVVVKTLTADVSNEEDLARALAEIRKTMPPLRGVIHAAGTLDDHLLVKLEADNFRKVMAPKVAGSWNLHTLTKDAPLDFFVVFSSIAAVLGSPGQANYAAANAFMDGLAHYRRAKGMTSLSIDWGPWADIGMAARVASSRGVASRAMRQIPPARALAAFDLLFEKSGPAQVVVMSVDWTQLARTFNGQQPPALISELVREKAKPIVKKTATETGPRLSAQELMAAPPSQQHKMLLGHVQRSVAQVMALEAPELDPEESMSNLGLDSLMALELQHSLEENFSVKLPIEMLLGMPSLNEFVSRLLSILTTASAMPENDAIPEPETA